MGILQPRQAWGCRFRQLRLRLDLDLGAIFLAAVSREYDKQIPAFRRVFCYTIGLTVRLMSCRSKCSQGESIGGSMFGGRTVAVVVLAGGKGTRFRGVAGTGQKVLWSVAGKPLIQYTTDLLDPTVIGHVVFNLGYRAKDVKEWVKMQALPFRRVSMSTQRKWTFRDAVTRAVAMIDEEVVVICNADEIRTGLNLNEVIDFHCRQGALVTLIGVRKRRLGRYRLLHVNEERVLTASEYCPERFREDDETEGLVNGGIAVLRREALLHLDASDLSAGWDAMLKPLTAMRQIRVFIAMNVGYYNVGTREELIEVEAYLRTDVGKDSG